MTPSQQAKNQGLASLAQVSKLTKQSPQTLTNWHKHKPELFAIVLLGCVKTGEQDNEQTTARQADY
jgi:hypothetical protein